MNFIQNILVWERKDKKMGISYKREEIRRYIQDSIVEKLTDRSMDKAEKLAKRSMDKTDNTRQIENDENSKERENLILKAEKRKQRNDFQFCYSENLNPNGYDCDIEEKISTKIIRDVLNETLEKFAKDFEIVKEQVKFNGRCKKELNKDGFNIMYKNFLGAALDIDFKNYAKKNFVVFKRNWAEDGEWFFSYSTSVDMVLVLAEYFTSYYNMIGLNEKEKEKFKKEYEKYPAICNENMIDSKYIYRWDYRLLVKKI